jgi:4-hydroxy-tetrahydrodipicolinate synthase
MPREAAELCAAWRAGDTARAAALQLGYLDLMNTLFCEVNPIPVKTAMSLMGYGTEEFRLPLCEMQPANKEKLIAVLRKHNLLA